MERVAKMAEFFMKKVYGCIECKIEVHYTGSKYIIDYNIPYYLRATFGRHPKNDVITEIFRQEKLSQKQAPSNRIICEVEGYISRAKQAMADQDWKLGELQFKVQSTAAEAEAEVPAEAEEPAPAPAAPQKDIFRVGDIVYMKGLKSEPQLRLNSQRFKVKGFTQRKFEVEPLGKTTYLVPHENLTRDPSSASAPPPALPAKRRYVKVGETVVIFGLKKYPSQNGKVGTVKGYDDDKGRYNVTLEDGNPVKVLPNNMSLPILEE